MKNLMIPLGLALSLAACTPTTPPPPPPATYPYNPNASAVESTDPRIPYAGEWVWVAAFEDNTVTFGKMDVDERDKPGEGFTNIGVAWNVLCASAEACPQTPYGNDTGLVATYTRDGKSTLAVAGYATATQSVQFVAFDDDGQVMLDQDGDA